jgi:hypothetical protein
MLARLPLHPNIVHLDHPVLDTITRSRVIGFIMRCIPGGTLDKSPSRLKLKWLKQLMQAADDMNHIIHLLRHRVS